VSEAGPRPLNRRVLLVVSDGCPMEAATELANDRHYLDHHLRQVAGAIEAAGRIELHAIGVGLDLSPYYGRGVVLDLERGATMRLFEEIVTALASHRSR